MVSNAAPCGVQRARSNAARDVGCAGELFPGGRTQPVTMRLDTPGPGISSAGTRWTSTSDGRSGLAISGWILAWTCSNVFNTNPCSRRIRISVVLLDGR